MVLEFVKSGRHQEFLSAVHHACGHLDDLLKLDHDGVYAPEMASALAWPDALRHHLQRDAEALITWHEEVCRLISRFPLAKQELDTLDPLDASRLASLLNRAETSLASAIRNYPEVIRFLKDKEARSPSFQGFIETVHRNLAEARSYVGAMEEIVSRLAEKQDHAAGARFERDTHWKDARKERVDPPVESSLHPGETPALRIEASSYFTRQWHHGDVPSREFHIALHKAGAFTLSGNIPSVPWHGEPHCYGGAPEHLNGVVVGGQQRLVYYVDERSNEPVLRLCCWISHSDHHDAFSRLRHQNLYRRIISNDSSKKVTRTDFDGFEEFGQET